MARKVQLFIRNERGGGAKMFKFLRNFTIIFLLAADVSAALTCSFLFSNVAGLEKPLKIQEAFRDLNANRSVIATSSIQFSKSEIDSIAATITNNSERGDIIVIRIKEGSVRISQNSNLFPASVQMKLNNFTSEILRQFKIQRKKPIMNGTIILRVTSDSSGPKVEGFHNHASPHLIDAVDFVWTLEGPGTLIENNQTVVSVPTNVIIFFGMNVMHGSPDSSARRVLVLGDFETN